MTGERHNHRGHAEDWLDAIAKEMAEPMKGAVRDLDTSRRLHENVHRSHVTGDDK